MKQISSSGNVDRLFEADRGFLPSQLLRDRACPPLAGFALSRLSAGEIGFDEVARHASTLRPRPRRGKGQNVLTLRAWGEPVSAAGGRVPCASAHELGIDVSQVAGNRPLAQEQRRGDLPVRPALGNQGGDAMLGRRQPLLARAAADPSRSSTLRTSLPLSNGAGQLRSGIGERAEYDAIEPREQIRSTKGRRRVLGIFRCESQRASSVRGANATARRRSAATSVVTKSDRPRSSDSRIRLRPDHLIRASFA